MTVLLIARFLTPNEQGYYYTFYSLVALQVVFELGFSFVVLQLAAHERARLTFAPDGRIEGDPVAHSRLASVLQKSVRWYSVAAVLMVATLLPTGLYFFGAHQHAGVAVAWKGPWCLLVVAAALTFQLDPVFAFVEGCGFVSQIARMRLGQAVLGSLLAWAAMATHHGLFSPAMLILGQATVQLAFLSRAKLRRLLMSLLRHPVDGNSVGWRQEIWPFQWRIAITWLSSYFISAADHPGTVLLPGADSGRAHGNVAKHCILDWDGWASVDEHEGFTLRQYDRPRRNRGAGQSVFPYVMAIHGAARDTAQRVSSCAW